VLALLYLTSAESRDVQQGAPASDELDLPDARAQVRQLIRAALEAPSPAGLAWILPIASDAFLPGMRTWPNSKARCERNRIQI
jgi:hypothetical protein